MSISKMLFAGAISLAAASFVACGDSDSSSGTSSNGSTYDPTAPVTATLAVDEEKSTITILAQESGERCVYENASFTWKEMLLESDTTTYFYKFSGDTLILARSKHDYEAVALVDGPANSLYGTWRTTDKGCSYDMEAEEYDCSIYDKSYYYEYTFKEGSVTSQLVIVNKDSEAEALEEALNKYNASHKFKDYVHSELTTTIMKGVISGDFDGVSAGEAFEEDSSGFESLVKKYEIEILGQKGQRIDLKFGDSYEVSIEYMSSTEMAEDGSSYSLGVAVTYGETTETLKSEGSVMTKKLCSADNEDNFEVAKSIDPATENTYTYVSAYAKSNIKLFRSSLEDLFAPVSKKLSKKSTSVSDDDYEYSEAICELYPSLCKSSAKERISADEAMMKLYKTFTK